MNSIKVLGCKEYRSIVEAWKALSPPTLKLITLRMRLRNGWAIDDAFLLDVVKPKDRRKFKELHRDW